MRKILYLVLAGATCLLLSCSEETPNDVETWMLQGNVSKYTDSDNMVFCFDIDHKLETVSIDNETMQWKGNVETSWEGNTLTALLPNGSKWVRTFDEQGRQTSFDYGRTLVEYIYEGDDFLPIKTKQSNADESYTFKIVYDSIDEHGNWLKAYYINIKASDDIIDLTQQIEYYSQEDLSALRPLGVTMGVRKVLQWLLLPLLWAIFGIVFYGYYQKYKGNEYTAWIKKLTRIAPLFLLVSLLGILFFHLDHKWMVNTTVFGGFIMTINVACGLAMMWCLFKLLDWKEVANTLKCKYSVQEMLLMLLTLLTYAYLSMLIFFTVLSIAIFILACGVLYFIVTKFILPSRASGAGSGDGKPNFKCCSSCCRFSSGHCSNKPSEQINDPDHACCGDHSF